MHVAQGKSLAFEIVFAGSDLPAAPEPGAVLFFEMASDEAIVLLRDDLGILNQAEGPDAVDGDCDASADPGANSAPLGK
jgi:hypothetical protein